MAILLREHLVVICKAVTVRVNRQCCFFLCLSSDTIISCFLAQRGAGRHVLVCSVFLKESVVLHFPSIVQIDMFLNQNN